MRKSAFLLVALLCFASVAHAAGEAIRIPLSKVSAGNISIEYVCRPDGVVGPFINTANVSGSAPEAVSLFSGFDLIRFVTFFEAQGMRGEIALPDGWAYVRDDTLSGFFISATALTEPGRSFSGHVKALTGQMQLYALQLATTKFVAARINDRTFVAEIDVSAFSAETFSQCLDAAGYGTALSALRESAAAALPPAELRASCLAINAFHDGLQRAMHTAPEAGRKIVASYLQHAAQEKPDCFQGAQLSQPALAAAAATAASLPRNLDYGVLALSGQQRPLPGGAYGRLREAWHANQPSILFAVNEHVKTVRLGRLKQVYGLYSQILACNEVLGRARIQLFSSPEAAGFRTRLDWLEARYRDEMDTGTAWDEVMEGYPNLLSSIRRTLSISMDFAITGCVRHAGRFRVLSTRLMEPARLTEKVALARPKDF